MTNQLITIAHVTIRQDSCGRYCLNDLHEASGSAPKDRPGQWGRTEAFKDLAWELQRDREESRCTDMHIAPVSSVYGGMAGQGTFVMKELVYAYAMWISPKFNLQVIRAYDKLVSQPQAAPVATTPVNYREAMMLAIENHEKLEAARLVIAVAQPKADVYDTVVAHKNTTISSFARMFPGVNSMATKRDLATMNYLHSRGGLYQVYSKYRDVLFGHSLTDEFGKHDITVLDKGKELLTKLYREGRLTMKVGFKGDC